MYSSISSKFLHGVGVSRPFLVIVQCDSGHLNSDLIACARYRIHEEALKAENQGQKNTTHILFIIRLPQQVVKSQFVGFQSDPWVSMHIDDLRTTTKSTVLPEEALNASISELFIGQIINEQPHQSMISEDDVQQQVEKIEESYESDYNHQNMTFNRSTESSSGYQPSSDSKVGIDIVEEGFMDVESNEQLFTTHVADTEDMERMDIDQLPYEDEQNSITGTGRIQDEQATMELDEKISLEKDSTKELKNLKVFYPQHQRLLGCVQAAVSQLKDSDKDRAMSRIHKLMALIPRAPLIQIGRF